MRKLASLLVLCTTSVALIGPAAPSAMANSECLAGNQSICITAASFTSTGGNQPLGHATITGSTNKLLDVTFYIDDVGSCVAGIWVFDSTISGQSACDPYAFVDGYNEFHMTTNPKYPTATVTNSWSNHTPCYFMVTGHSYDVDVILDDTNGSWGTASWEHANNYTKTQLCP